MAFLSLKKSSHCRAVDVQFVYEHLRAHDVATSGTTQPTQTGGFCIPATAIVSHKQCKLLKLMQCTLTVRSTTQD